MRFILIIFSVGLVAFSCVKQKTSNPIPLIEFEDVYHLQKSEYTGSDTGLLTIKYEDGDGDLFLDGASDGPNIIFTPYYFDTITNKFTVTFFGPDTIKILGFVLQPDDGYYKGKSIKGAVYIPMRQYRPNDSAKQIYFTGFAIDKKGNKSNIVTSPIYTLNF